MSSHIISGILSDLIYCPVTKFLRGTFPLKDHLVILSKYIPDLLDVRNNLHNLIVVL